MTEPVLDATPTKVSAADVKEEILTQKISKKCCKCAFLAGVFRGAGSFYLSHDGYGVRISHHDDALISKSAVILHSLTRFEAEVTLRISSREVGAKNIYEFQIPSGDVYDRLTDMHVLPPFGDVAALPSPAILANECCKISFIKGLFVACGTISVPFDEKAKSSGGYYMDLTLSNESVAALVCDLLNSLGANAKIRKRMRAYSVYMKEAEAISDMVCRLGAMNAVCAIQNIMVFRAVKNDSNRYTNCESANISKTVNAAIRQTEAIKKIIRAGLMDTLDADTREVAEARMENPSATLSQLSEIIPSHPGRGAINFRLKKLVATGDAIEDNHGKSE